METVSTFTVTALNLAESKSHEIDQILEFDLYCKLMALIKVSRNTNKNNGMFNCDTQMSQLNQS